MTVWEGTIYSKKVQNVQWSVLKPIGVIRVIKTDTQKIVTQLRLLGWSEAVKERLASGQTVHAFCEEKGISQTTYYYRQKKVREAACTELMRTQNCEDGAVPSGWVQLTRSEEPVTTAAENNLIIEIGGFHLAVNGQTDMELLAKVCRMMKSL
jgi:putative transposase